ncbi:MAG: methyltransferase domain-containing protein [Clostridia bacterium]|nr:methyltransferase domain-containing protein [Clostridia bacterium]
MASLYDRADIYDLGFTQKTWEQVKEHWQIALSDAEISSILDVSIGSGMVTLPLAEMGYRLTGSDLSETMLRKCRSNADERRLDVDLHTSDFRTIDTALPGRTFDCVMSTGNSLPYIENEEIPAALTAMDKLVRPGGYIYLDSRNWDRILRNRQRFYFYRPQTLQDGTRMDRFQVWDYNADGSMTFNLVFTFEKDGKVSQREIFEERYHPAPRRIFEDSLKELGYEIIALRNYPAQADLPVDEFDWYCILAQKQ